MFGKNDDQNQPIGDVSGISLPPQQPAPSPQFAAPTPPPTVPVQDLSMPELAANTGTPPPQATQSWSVPSAPVTGTPSGDLSTLKQRALSELSPLIGQLEQTPEEKFRTTMMMIQAADDQTLIGAAYEAAQKITDEKAKAQALLDVINEINYFTQKQNS